MAEGRRLTEHYRLDRLVRTGDQGLFFAAVDTRSGQPVGVEMIREAAADRGGHERARFLATAATLRALDHPSLPRVLDYGFTAAGNAFLITECLSGTSFAALAGSPPRRVLALLLGVLDGVAALAQQGLALPHLRAEGFLVTETTEGERVKLVELGEAVPAGNNAVQEARRDLAFLACHLLGATLDGDGRVNVPEAAAGQLEDVAALEQLLASWLRPADPGPPPTFEELRRRLRFLLGGGLSTLPATPVSDLFAPVTAASPASAASAAPARPAAAKAPTAARTRRSAVLAGAAAAGLGLAAVLFLVLALRHEPAESGPQATTPELSPLPSSAPPPAIPTPSPSPLPAEEPRLARAEGLLADQDWESLRRELAGIAPAERETFAADEHLRLQAMLDSLAAADAKRLAADLSRGLASGSVPVLRSAVAFSSRVPAKKLKSAVKLDLTRAKDALAADSGLGRAEKSGDARQILGAAADLLALLPANARAQKLRDQAAASLEAAAEAALSAGRLDEAAADLEAVRGAVPQRPGLADRLARLDRERRGDQSLAGALAEATRLGEQDQPLEGLARLARATPNDRYRDRFTRLQEKLNRQLAEIDRGAPQVRIREGFEPSYEKDRPITVPLRISDDYGVKSVEAWLTMEGGQRKAVPVIHGSGEAYEATLGAALHANQNVELWVAATDHSGHRTQLGPTSLRRKRWYDALGLSKQPEPP